uniref:Uncharacterized protein n=1 Tax=Skeletonema marinoi TaxID=267567 RepID=A0A7S0TFP3_9STRA|mmetsp:Transcript_116/g.239  ORF Transcript_116/g.239 Transcript_116/m.239 type:complete len:373 (+) Transcript_116:31-1149(+)
MFVKKDLRKIPQILADASQRAASSPPSLSEEEDDTPPTKKAKSTKNEIITEMRLGRRAPEFLPSCNASILLQPKFRPALDNLIQLSLYDCGLSSLAGIELHPTNDDDGMTLFPKLEQLDIGRNPKLTNDSLPDSFHTQFPSLLELWCDDCSFGPTIPNTLLQMHQLHVVRMTMNKLEGQLEQGIGIKYWNHIRVLAMDGNKLDSVGKGIGRLEYLEKLHLRQNKLSSLPEGVPSADNTSLTMLCLSSNLLTSLPKSILDVADALTELYVNGNQLQTLPEGLAQKCTWLQKFNVAHNNIDKEELLPKDFVMRFGLPDVVSGQCTKDDACVVRLEGNPMAERRRKAYLEEEKAKAKALEMERAAAEMEVDSDDD